MPRCAMLSSCFDRFYLFLQGFLQGSTLHLVPRLFSSLVCRWASSAAVLAIVFNYWTAVGLWGQNKPIYLEKYTITKIYFEGAEELNRYYIFSYLQFKEGDTFTPLQLETRIEDSRQVLRTQWYFQADFEVRYYTEGRVEIYVILEPSPKRLSFMGGLPDGHSVYIGFGGERRNPGSALRFHIGKTTGLSWYLPRINNSLFGLNIVAEFEVHKFFEYWNIEEIGLATMWLRSGIEEFIRPDFAIQLGFAQQYWGALDLENSGLVNELVVAAIADLNWLYLLKSRLWGMQFYFRIDGGILTGLLLLRSEYKLALLPFYWLELNAYLNLKANIQERWPIGALNPETPGIDIESNGYDFNVLARLRGTAMLTQHDYDSQRSEFNLGLALEGKLGLYAGLFDADNPLPFEPGLEIQGGLVLEVLSPGAFSTRFYFLLGVNLLNDLPVAEFMVESRY